MKTLNLKSSKFLEMNSGMVKQKVVIFVISKFSFYLDLMDISLHSFAFIINILNSFKVKTFMFKSSSLLFNDFLRTY
jgi:hypothetical protein